MSKDLAGKVSSEPFSLSEVRDPRISHMIAKLSRKEFIYDSRADPVYQNQDLDFDNDLTEFISRKRLAAAHIAERDQAITVGEAHGQWTSRLALDARIVEVQDTVVILDCLVQRSEQRFETRAFPKRLLEGGGIDIEVGKYVVVRIFEGKNKAMYTFSRGDKIVKREYFEKDFSHLDDMGLDEPFRPQTEQPQSQAKLKARSRVSKRRGRARR